MMTLLGVSDNQIETISFGKEKPKSRARRKLTLRKTAAPISFISAKLFV